MINTININVTSLIATISVTINTVTCTLLIKLPSLSYTNQSDIETIVSSLNWAEVKDNKFYHLEAGVLIETPASPGATYKFDYVTNIWRDTRTQEEMWKAIRLERAVLLKASDWTQMLDVQLPNKEAWAVYRQALRDITNQTDPFNITWPTAPGG